MEIKQIKPKDILNIIISGNDVYIGKRYTKNGVFSFTRLNQLKFEEIKMAYNNDDCILFIIKE